MFAVAAWCVAARARSSIGALKSTPTTLQPVAASNSESSPDPLPRSSRCARGFDLGETREAGDAGESLDRQPRHSIESIARIASGLRQPATHHEGMFVSRTPGNVRVRLLNRSPQGVRGERTCGTHSSSLEPGRPPGRPTGDQAISQSERDLLRR